jgi:predicted dehydrogenase
MRFLIVGCGSIGERHIRNIKSLSLADIIVHDVNSERLSTIGQKYDVQTYQELGSAFDQNVDAAFVCTPPNTHICIAQLAIEHNVHVFVEKPISHRLEGVNKLLKDSAERGLIVYVGYNLRFHPGLNVVKNMLDEAKIGRVLSAHMEFGQYLPYWRPQQDYRQSYTARKNLGGGIILDASHEIDYARWFLGEVKEVFCFAGRLSSLEVETEDTAQILLRFESGAIADVHLDFVQRAYSRYCKLIGEDGTILWNHADKVIKLYHPQCGWTATQMDFDPYGAYVEEIKHFVDCILAREQPRVDGITGKKVLEIALAAKRSAQEGKLVRL